MQINKKKLGIWVGSVIVVLALVGSFFANYELLFKSPVNVQLHTPVKVAKRQAKIITVTQQAKAENISPLTEDQQYLCNKFGKDCKIALAVQKAENGTGQCDRFNVNSNGTIDVGFMQINSVHLKKGYKLAELADCKKNIDIAFEIYSQQKGFQAWVAFSNGAYKKFLY